MVWTDGHVTEGCLRGLASICSDVCRQLLFSASLNFSLCFFHIVSGNQKPLSCTHVGLQASAFELCEQPQLPASLLRPFSSVLALSGLVAGGRKILPLLPRWTKKTPPRCVCKARTTALIIVSALACSRAKLEAAPQASFFCCHLNSKPNSFH